MSIYYCIFHIANKCLADNFNNTAYNSFANLFSAADQIQTDLSG